MANAEVLIAAFGAMMFLALAIVRPVAAMAVALGAAPFAYDLFGAPVRIAAGELCAAIIALVTVVRGPKRVRLGPFLPWIPPYLAICVLSSLLHWREMAGVALAQSGFYMVIVVAAFAATAFDSTAFLPPLIALVAAGMVLASAELAFRSSYVLMLHKNSIGTSISSALVVTTGLWLWIDDQKLRWGLATVAVVLVAGLVISLSRGGWIGAAAGVLVLAIAFGNFRFLMKGALLLIPVAIAGWVLAPERLRFTAGLLSANAYNVWSRLQFIQRGWAEFAINPLLGTGAGLGKDLDSTNIVVATLAESGVLGLAAFLMVHWTAIGLTRTVVRSLPQTDARFVIASIGLALLVTHFAHGLVDHYWSRGGSLIAWAGAAMVLAVYLDVRQAKVPPAEIA